MQAAERFAELVAVRGEQVPLDEAAALIAQSAEPELKTGAMLAQLDALAETCPGYTLDVLVPHLFGRGRFGPDRSDYYDPRNSLLNHVLERRVGIPITLSVLALEVGRRVGVPMAGVGMPGHFLLRDKVDRTVFIDPFHGGRLLDERQCQALFHQITGADSDVVRGVPRPGREPVDRGPHAQQPAHHLRAPPGPGRAALGDGAADLAAGALRRRPRGVRPGHGPAQLTPLARSRLAPTPAPATGHAFRPPHPVSSLPG